MGVATGPFGQIVFAKRKNPCMFAAVRFHFHDERVRAVAPARVKRSDVEPSKCCSHEQVSTIGFPRYVDGQAGSRRPLSLVDIQPRRRR